MTNQLEGEGFFRWAGILVCSVLASMIIWPVIYILMSISPIPVTLYTTGLPASLFTGGAFVLAGLLASKTKSDNTAMTLAIVFTILSVCFLFRAGNAARVGEYIVMGIFGPIGAWWVSLNRKRFL